VISEGSCDTGIIQGSYAVWRSIEKYGIKFESFQGLDNGKKVFIYHELVCFEVH